MKSILVSGAVAALIAGPALADETTDAIAQLRQELEALKTRNDRLEAEVDYLKANASAGHKDSAEQTAAVDTLKSTVAKYTWSGDLRVRHELIDTAPNTATPEHTRERDRVRLRFGVAAKVNDTVTAKIQLSTVNSGDDNPRSTNQTEGEAWSRKAIGIDLAYVDWKLHPQFNLQLGKHPQPWVRTASYFWDGDLTPEGAALKFSRGPVFGGLFYDWLGERDNNTTPSLRSDAKLLGAQLGMKPQFGPVTLTGAVAYYEITNVRDQIASATPASGNPSGGTCAINPAFSGSTNGNTVYNDNGASAHCSRLLSGFKPLSALLQADLKLGRFPLSVFADYMQNTAAVANPVAGSKLDTAWAFGFTFNKASAPKSWELGYVYQKTEKDAVFGQFVDSDFGGGVTDTKGSVFKAAWVPAANWTLNGTYFINTRFNAAPSAANTHDLDYKRLQLDLNYKY
ncbi:MAG: putative porin [Steroidobacteraceae bacterium]